MLQNVNRTLREISNVVEEIGRDRTNQARSIVYFTKFMDSRMGTLSEDRQSRFVDQMMAIFIFRYKKIPFVCMYIVQM